MHGIVRTSASMDSFAEYLEGEGYEVINIDYPSTKYTVEELAKKVYREIVEKTPDKNAKVNFVAYSMGTLITRIILSDYEMPQLGRVVFVAPPSQGSEVADWLKDNILYRTFYGISGQQLGTGEDGIAAQLGDVDYELGIIAGNHTIDPISSTVIPGDDDGKVAVERTKIEGMTDHIIIPATHTFIITNKTAMKQAVHFLQNGEFYKK